MDEQLRIIISAEVSKLRQGIENAKQQLQSFKSKVEEAKKNVDKNFKAIGESINTAAKASAKGIAAFGAALVANVFATEEYRNQQAQLVTAFEAAGSSAAQATETYNGLYRVLGDGGQAQEAAQHLAKLTTEEKALNQWNTILQGTFSTFGASLPIESLTEAANETAKTGALTGALADALNWAGVNEEEFQAKLDATNTEAEREKIIRETLLGLYSDAAAKYEENNAQVLAQRDAQAALQEKLAAVGAALAPVITAFTSFAADALALVSPYVEDLAETLLPDLKTILENVTTAIQDAAKWIKENEAALTAIAIAIGVVVAAIGMYNAVAAIKAAMAAAEVATVWGLVTAYAAQAAAMIAAIAPYVLVVAAIAAIIAIIMNWGEIWEWIKGIAAQAWEGIKKAWNSAGEWFSKNVVEPIKNTFSNIGKWFSDKFKSAWDGIKKAFSAVGSFFSGIWNNIKKIFSDVGSAIAGGIKGAVSSAVNSVLKTAANIINTFISGINFAIGIINAIPGVNIAKLNKLSVPAMAKGGVVDSATLALIGENGKEAVLPLENNLEYLDKLAGMLNERMGGNQPIVLNIDGKRFAEISCENINKLTRQRGSIPLVIA